MKSRPWTASEDALLVALDEGGVDYGEIAGILSRSRAAIRNRFYRKHPDRDKRQAPFTAEDDAVIRAGYAAAGDVRIDLTELARKLGRHRGTVCSRARFLDQTSLCRPHRPESVERQRLAQIATWKTRPHPMGMLGRKHKPEALAKMAAAAAKNHTGQKRPPETCAKLAEIQRRRLANPERSPYCSGTKGKRPDLGDVCFRSSWEANIARWLTHLGVRWQYEPTVFQFVPEVGGTLSYTPDFYLPDEDRYIEVKGWWDTKSRLRMQKMIEQYPTVRIEIIDAEHYGTIASEFSTIIPGWERRTYKVRLAGMALRPDFLLEDASFVR
jgi:hypothetical protein